MRSAARMIERAMPLTCGGVNDEVVVVNGVSRHLRCNLSVGKPTMGNRGTASRCACQVNRAMLRVCINQQDLMPGLNERRSETVGQRCFANAAFLVERL